MRPAQGAAAFRSGQKKRGSAAWPSPFRFPGAVPISPLGYYGCLWLNVGAGCWDLQPAIDPILPMDRITSLTTFVKVVDCGGFAAAARALDVSPSSVTIHIRTIEERL